MRSLARVLAGAKIQTFPKTWCEIQRKVTPKEGGEPLLTYEWIQRGVRADSSHLVNGLKGQDVLFVLRAAQGAAGAAAGAEIPRRKRNRASSCQKEGRQLLKQGLEESNFHPGVTVLFQIPQRSVKVWANPQSPLLKTECLNTEQASKSHKRFWQWEICVWQETERHHLDPWMLQQKIYQY